MTTSFSAADPTLGYLYQVRQALHFLLSSPEETELTIEKFDDVAFEKNGTPIELIQLKHHRTPASLSDGSPDLWKTIRVWCSSVDENRVLLSTTVFSLMTTGKAPSGSIAELLRAGGSQRNPVEAHKRLLDTANTSKNKELESCFKAFVNLSEAIRLQLVDAIRVFDSGPDISDVVPLIKDKLIRTAHRKHRDNLYERLEGWWINKVIKHLLGDSTEPISCFDVNAKIIDLGLQFAEDNLPIDFLDAEPPTSPDPKGDQRLFVQQLRAIAINNKRIEKAIRDYYRAFEQRSKWVRDELLINEDLEIYEKKLVDEWERCMLELLDRHSGASLDEVTLQQQGQELYRWMEQEASIYLKPKVTEEYVMRGTYHLLADRLRKDGDRQIPFVWWHPKFIERLEALLLTG